MINFENYQVKENYLIVISNNKNKIVKATIFRLAFIFKLFIDKFKLIKYSNIKL